MDVLDVHVAVFEDQIAADRFHAGAFEVRRPLVDDGGGVTVVKSSADGWIAVADDFDVAGERAGVIDSAAHEDGGGELEVGMEEIDRGRGREELHVRRRRERRPWIALRDDGAAVDFHDLQAGAGAGGDATVHQRVDALGERTARCSIRRSSRRSPARTRLLRPPLCSAGDGSDQNQKEREYHQSRGPNRHQMRGTFLKCGHGPRRYRCQLSLIARRAPCVETANHKR